ncbi:MULTISPECIES: DUF3592 domain-containing protein [unclassified Kitasatospora]|uniref:DUF3592 domain-containing protein n=1 Tax=unclassified Kitasatospora TaxID=2633591 RepID=UPI003444F249
MGWHDCLALWCGVFGTLALLGYGRSLAGVTRAQRTVRVMGRIERVQEPRHGGSEGDGIAVVVTFQDSSTGQEFTVTNDGDCGDRINTAWTGREIGIRYPPGRPHAFRFTNDLWAGRYGLGWPNFAVFLIYVGLVVVAAIDWGWPWALIGVGAPWSVFLACSLPQEVRQARSRFDTLAAMVPVPGRVVAVVRNVRTDEDGYTSTSQTPVVAFTTHEGVAVTAYCFSGLPDPTNSYGRNVTIHYSPADPADFTPDLASAQRSWRSGVTSGIVGLLVTASAAVVGAVLL